MLVCGSMHVPQQLTGVRDTRRQQQQQVVIASIVRFVQVSGIRSLSCMVLGILIGVREL